MAATPAVTDSPGMPMIPARHLSDVELAAFMDGTLAGDERAGAASHLAVCSVCRGELVATSGLVERLPAGGPRSPRRLWAYGGVAAAAAILAISILPRTEYLDRASADLERRPAERVARIAAVAPAEGVEVEPRALTFSWQGESGASYRITVTDASGRTVWSVTTTETAAAMPGDVTLAPAERFYWYVDGLLADGTSLSSGQRSFTTSSW